MDGRPRARVVVQRSAFIFRYAPSFPYTTVSFEIQVFVLILCKAGQIAIAIFIKHISILHGIIIINGERAGGNSGDTAKPEEASFLPFTIVNIDKSSSECGIISMIVGDGNHIDQMAVSN